MTRTLLAAGLGGLLLFVAPAGASPAVWSATGSLVDVSITLDGRPAPLFAARDGSGRFYLEAREGARYEVRIENRSHERLGVALRVDGLNAISGERERARLGRNDPGRLYVLEPWQGTTVRGWRTSLEDVRRFTFVDEQASYAARTGQANAHMGWIEVAVHREQPRPYVWRQPAPAPITPDPARDREARAQDAPSEPKATAPPRTEAAGGTTTAPESDALEARRADGAGRSYPGTGWGRREWDRAVVVAFDPCPTPAETITLRYEYAPELRRLGVLSWPWPPRDRLLERDRGFARPPR